MNISFGSSISCNQVNRLKSLSAQLKLSYLEMFIVKNMPNLRFQIYWIQVLLNSIGMQKKVMY